MIMSKVLRMLTKPTGSYVKLFPSALMNILAPFKSLFWFLSLSLTSVSAKQSRKTLQFTSLGIKWLKLLPQDGKAEVRAREILFTF